MRILVVSNMYPSKDAPSYGVFVKNFCDQLAELDISYSLSIMLKSRGRLSKVWSYINFYIKTFFKCILGKYDIIYVHYASHSSIPVIFASKFKKLHIYTNLHGSDVIPENKKQEKMQRFTRDILILSYKIIVPSKYFKRVVAKKYGVNLDKLYISHSGGVDRKIFFKEINVKKNFDILRIGFVGRISYGKGWNTLLNACSMLNNSNYHLTIVGNGPQMNQMNAEIEKLHLSPYVKILDLIPQLQLRGIYNEIDVFVFPTEREGESLGLVAIEAMACGTPVIASDFAAPSDYIINGYNGYKYEMGNAKKLSEILLKFQSLSYEERRCLELGALETAVLYSKENVTEELKHILLEK